MDEGINAQMEINKRISEGMKCQIGKIRKRRAPDETADDLGSKLKSYMDVIFIQIVLLLLLYGVCVLVVPTLV